MKEEDNIQKLVGRDNPFRMPDGYLDGLTAQVMSRLPEKDASTSAPVPPAVPLCRESATPRLLRLRPWLYAAAAMLAGAVLLLRFASSPVTPVDTLAADESESEMEYINMAVENSLLADSYDLYIYLADAEAE